MILISDETFKESVIFKHNACILLISAPLFCFNNVNCMPKLRTLGKENPAYYAIYLLDMLYNYYSACYATHVVRCNSLKGMQTKSDS